MDTINQVACKVQGNQWIEIGDLFTGCTSYENMRLVIAVSIALFAVLFIAWLYASVKCMVLEYQRNKAQSLNMVLRDSLVIMNESK